jgi:Ser/Thr protein kinase RdoA (MazF antagonist)
MGAELSIALAGFDHPGLDRAFQWDLKHAADICEALAPFASTPERRDLLDASIARAMTALTPLILRLRVQVVHADITDQNTLGTRDAAGRLVPSGIIDFGDLSRTWLGRDLAVTIAADTMFDVDHPLRIATELTRGATGTLPLTDAELAALWPLVVARAASVAISGDHQASLEPDNAYVIESARPSGPRSRRSPRCRSRSPPRRCARRPGRAGRAAARQAGRRAGPRGRTGADGPRPVDHERCAGRCLDR